MAELTTEEVRRIITLARKLNAFHDQLKEGDTVANRIKGIQVPESLSITLALRLLRECNLIPKLSGFSFREGVGKPEGDIIATREEERQNVEVKATGIAGFASFGKHDRVADFLIWILFNDYLRKETDEPFEVLVTPKPGRFIGTLPKMTIREFRRKAGEEALPHWLTLDEILNGNLRKSLSFAESKGLE